MRKRIILLGLACFQLCLFHVTANNKKDSIASQNKYKYLVDSVSCKTGLFPLYQDKSDYYFEISDSLLNRDFLIVNRILKVPYELNEQGLNKGINYENTLIRFELNKASDKLFIRNIRPKPQYPEDDFIALSVHDNFISPLMGSLKVEGYSPDSSSVIVKVNDLYNGSFTFFNNLFKSISIGGSITKDLSRIVDIKPYKNSITAISELSTKVEQGDATVYLTVESSSSIVLLPEQPMSGRFLSPRVGYFTVPYTYFSDKQSNVEKKELITRWRLEPKDEAAYLRGELVEPKKPIVFYLDKSTPKQWRKYMKRGIEDWQIAFEKAGFKNAIIAKEFSEEIDEHNIDFSSITYVASDKMNAMGPSVYDPRSGEIIQADIIWWHNVISMLRNWIVIQTGAAQTEAQAWNLPEDLLGDAMRFVACHEVGHSLGLRHNMIGSSAFPVDSLRSNDFVKKWGTSTSIMDYSRYNYVAQPGDGVEIFSPQIGVYDLFAIEYGYRWSGKSNPYKEEAFLSDILEKHSDDIYRYSEAQDPRDAVNPRAQTEDLGDDPVKASEYGIANLKRLMPKILSITDTGKAEQDYREAGQLYYAIIGHWNNLVYHPLANVGGIYLENNLRKDNRQTYIFVPKEVQKKSVEFLIREMITDTDWLFESDLNKYTFPLRNTPAGLVENAPSLLLKNAQGYLFWDLLNNKRLVRMSENEYQNGNNAFTSVELMDMIYNAIFKVAESRKALTVKERFIQKGLVDALIQSASEDAVTKKNKSLTSVIDDRSATSEVIRQVTFYGSLGDRISDAVSVKRGLLMKIKQATEKGRRASDSATKYHYEDLLLRINSALNI
ncbi:MAG: zinc-dependent metalloprotease [Bacteroidia bacterium]|nr:zinc-dependent metalloprotease [Bacteroidia bacterium]